MSQSADFLVPEIKEFHDSNQDGMFFACAETKLNTKIIDSIREIGLYCPPWWYSKHLGTLIPFGRDLKLQYEREILVHPDNSEFAADWYPRKPSSEKQGDVPFHICLFVPGLGLSSNNKFCQNFVEYLWNEQGIFSVVVTHRGIGMPMKSSRF
jgi:predicted alpha/beta-fold hydrolase